MKTQNKLCCILKAMSLHFPHNIRIRLAQLQLFLLLPDVAKSLPCSAFLNWDSQQGRDRATSGPNKKNQLGQSYYYINYEEILVLSNLNSKQFRFHGVRPILHTDSKFACFYRESDKANLQALLQSKSLILICQGRPFFNYKVF